MRHIRILTSAVMMAFALACLQMPAALAQESDADRLAARAAFDRGVDLFRQHQWAEALAQFQEAHRLRPHPSVRVNMANCYLELGRPIEALFHFERYMQETSGTTPQRQQVETSIAHLRTLIGSLALHVLPDGASIRVDDAEERRSPVLEPIRIVAGQHTIVIRREGYREETRRVTVPGGGEASLSVQLERAPVAPPAVAAAPAPQPAPASSTTAPAVEAAPSSPSVVFEMGSPRREGRSDDADITTANVTGNVMPISHDESTSTRDSTRYRISTSTWIAGGVTVGLIGGAIATGVLALQAKSDFNDYADRSNDTSLNTEQRMQAVSDGQGASDRAHTLGIVTDVLIGAAVIGAASTVVIHFMTRTPIEDPAQARVHVAPWFGHNQAGLSVTATY